MNEGRPGRLILLCGLPGAGKTTLAKQLADQIPAVRLCPDDWLTRLGIDLHEAEPRDRLEGLFRQQSEDLLRLGVSVILEFGFWARAERDEIRLRARALGAAVELRYLPVPLDELWRRLEARNRQESPGIAVISRSMIEQWAEIFEAPDRSELVLFDQPWEQKDGTAGPCAFGASGGGSVRVRA
ncbi:AAA family ATPase [Streptosporangium sp. NPDC023825]|uniref:AAA family ATPase n=1 Tax=Streptosporangium sp. NPDC023825 TaxID=3154909 RepID=UPI00342E3B91